MTETDTDYEIQTESSEAPADDGLRLVEFDAYDGNSQVRQTNIEVRRDIILGAQTVAQYMQASVPDDAPEDVRQAAADPYWQAEIKVLLEGAKDLGLPFSEHNKEVLEDLGFSVELPEIPENEPWMEGIDGGDQD